MAYRPKPGDLVECCTHRSDEPIWSGNIFEAVVLEVGGKDCDYFSQYCSVGLPDQLGKSMMEFKEIRFIRKLTKEELLTFNHPSVRELYDKCG